MKYELVLSQMAATLRLMAKELLDSTDDEAAAAATIAIGGIRAFGDKLDDLGLAECDLPANWSFEDPEPAQGKTRE